MQESRRAINRRYYLKNRESILAKSKARDMANPEQRAFRRQKSQAKQRGIPFLLSFDEWVNWWGDDLPKRGKGKGTLAMCRHKDEGPYELDNIYKAYNGDNTRHYYEEH